MLIGCRFSINLCNGANFGQCDTALHINPRYDQGNVVVRNSFLRGQWGSEERGGPPFTVSRGQALDCMILIENDKIKVLSAAIN